MNDTSRDATRNLLREARECVTAECDENADARACAMVNTVLYMEAGADFSLRMPNVCHPLTC